MAVFGERLFLSFYKDSGIPATLVWLPTSGTSTAPPTLAPFPSWELHKNDNCDSIQSAKGMETDTDGRLWVLDQGSKKCPGKLWLFDLLYNDTIERVHQFPARVISPSFNERLLLDIVLDNSPDDNLAYITDSDSAHIIVYSRKRDKSWSVKTPGRKWYSLALSANREARRLYLGRYGSNELYSISVSELKNEGGSAAVKLIGEWTKFNLYRMVIDNANVLYAAFYRQNYLSKWNISEPFREQRFHEVGILDSGRPFTLALDTTNTLWMTERNKSESGSSSFKLLEAAVGAKSYLFSTSTVSTDVDETSEQQEITESSLRYKSTPPPSLKTIETQSLLGVFFINPSPRSQFIGQTQQRSQSLISLPFLILLQTCHCVADPENGKNVHFPGQHTVF
ncbi:protein yellow-like [Cloeon dipterum]|uniref:protein yellow-like n=1 Tax=Cloeon dipterum TaxID=197152 RepID=UPI0032202458